MQGETFVYIFINEISSVDFEEIRAYFYADYNKGLLKYKLAIQALRLRSDFCYSD